MKTFNTLLILSFLSTNLLFAHTAQASVYTLKSCRRLVWDDSEKTFYKISSKMIREARVNYTKNEISLRANVSLIDHGTFTIFALERFEMNFKGQPTDSFVHTKVVNGKKYISRNFTFTSLPKNIKISDIDRYKAKFTMAVTYSLDVNGNAITFDDFVYSGKNKIKRHATFSFDMLTKEGTNADRYYNTDDYNYSKWHVNIDRFSNIDNDIVRYHMTYPIGKLEGFTSTICNR